MLTAARGGVVSWPLAAAEAKDLVHHRGQFAEADGSAGHGRAAGGAGAGAGAGTSPTTATPRGTPGTHAQASPPPPPPVVPPRMYKPMGSQATDSQVAPPPIPPRPERVVTPPPPPLPPAGRGFGTIAGTTPHHACYFQTQRATHALLFSHQLRAVHRRLVVTALPPMTRSGSLFASR